MNLKRFQRIKAKLEARKRESDRAIGALELLLRRLQKEFSCDTIEEAEAMQEERKVRRLKAQEKLDRELDALEAKWEGKL